MTADANVATLGVFGMAQGYYNAFTTGDYSQAQDASLNALLLSGGTRAMQGQGVNPWSAGYIPNAADQALISALTGDSGNIGYHATSPANVSSILTNGLRESQGGRLGGAGAYVNNTPEGAMAEYMSVPGRPAPTVLQVQYSPGLNYTISPPPAGHTTGPLPFEADTLTTESIRLSGTFNTIVRNGSMTPLAPINAVPPIITWTGTTPR